MTIHQPPSTPRERTVAGLMGGNGNDAPKGSPQPTRKQTSLLSFFSTPSPKRPAAETRQDAMGSSPCKKKARDGTLLAVAPERISFYEMVSESDTEDTAAFEEMAGSDTAAKEEMTVNGMGPLSAGSHVHTVGQQTRTAKGPLDLASYSHAEGNQTFDIKEIHPLRMSGIDAGKDENGLLVDNRDSSNERYPWLVSVCDADGRAPDDPEYDPRTLYIPKSAWQKFTPFEKQFWEIKSQLFDTVVFFKKGKFYELYENDADIGAREFDLKMTDRVNMRMVGVPEATFEMWAARFVAARYKIARVDQTETAIGKSIREKETKGKAEKIIRRELSCILTAGTVTEPTMIASDSAAYCIAVKERVLAAEAVGFGVAIVDAATGTFQLCDFDDDVSRSTIETLLMQLQPKEIILEKGRVSVETRRVIRNLLSSALVTEASPEKEYWSRTKIADELDMAQYFSDSVWPAVLREQHQKETQSFLAFGALLWYLRMLKMDRGLLSYKNVLLCDPIKGASSLVLDGQTLLNLDILPSTLRSSVSAADARKGTLLSVVDHCVTPFGKRLIQTWLCHPLRSASAINARLDAVDYFLREAGLANEISGELKRLPDLERSLSRIHSGTAKLKDFLATIDGFKLITKVVDCLFNSKIGNGGEGSAGLPPIVAECLGEIPDYSAVIDYYLGAFDRQVALKEGQVIPFAGVEQEYDNAQAQFARVQSDLQAYLGEQEKALRIRGAQYRDIGKELFQLEISADVSVPREYILMSKTKTTKRYWTPRIKELVKLYQEWEERRSAILRGLYGKLLAQFDENIVQWRAAVSSIAKLDCLLSLSRASMLMGEPKCRPIVVDAAEAHCELRELRHPCVTDLASFIPNDVGLGGGQEQRMILLTGPNMGGKSTLLRQTCLAVILAQLGCYVTARECQMSPIDRIFTRLGANDNIIAGQSTFMVELLDTAKILKEATPRSLVILDELGRGTSTFDGMAIAHAVLLYLARVTRCVGLFATHYRPVAVDFMDEPAVACQFMSCYVDRESRRVTFLYKLTPGISPKSYGMNVAAMAGLPAELIDEADAIAEEFDAALSISIESRAHSKSRQLSRRLVDLLCQRAIVA